MKITAPVSRLEEIEPLAAAGADEFYLSVVSPDWLRRYRNAATSRRVFGNLPEYRDLESAVRRSHELGCSVTLTMNAQHYTAEQMRDLLETADWFAALDGDAVIAGDAALVEMLAGREYPFAIHVSSIATCRNTHAAAFYRELGARRIIFPRDITLSEMEAIVAHEPELEFEGFVLNEGCVYEEGLCHTIHLPSEHGGPICLDRYQSEYHRIDGASFEPEQQRLLEENEEHYRRWLWYKFSCGFSVTEQGLPYGPCGLCALPRMQRAGLTAVKIAGRDAPLERKQKSVEMVTAVRARLDQEESSVKHHARNLRGQPGHCESGLMCYYPEVLDQENR